MPRFRQRSSDRLSTCDQRIIALCNYVVIERDCTIIQGHRGESEQDAAYADGFSKIKWPHGRHNSYPSRAVDMAPWDANDPGIKWDDEERWTDFALYVMWASNKLGINILSGGISWGWDFAHYQLED